MSVLPTDLEFDPSGAPWSPRYGDVFSSRDGALGQARHVFLTGNGLPDRWAGQRHFTIVETGFGLGTNFLATWQAWRDDPRRPARLHVVSLEKHPLPARRLIEHAPPELAELARSLAAAWPPPLPGLHRLAFDDGRVVLTLGLGDAVDLAPELVAAADAFYLDGFAPARNPDLWSRALLKSLARLARPDATVATYTAAVAVREGLIAAGFEMATVPGFGRKREMLTGRFAPRWRVRRHEPPPPYAGERSALVIGGGLAGTACAAALARRGWSVRLLERGPRVASGASQLPVGLLHPHPSIDDNLAARLARAGFLFSRDQLQRIDPQREIWLPCGVFRQAEDAATEEAQRGLTSVDDWLAFVTAADASARVGTAVRRPGVWFGGGAAVAAARWCEAMSIVDGITIWSSAEVERLQFLEGNWHADCGGRIFAAPIVVLANGLDAGRLLDFGTLPLTGVPGRISLLAPGELPGLRAAIAGDGYLVPAFAGQPSAIGATYGEQSDDEAEAANLARLGRMIHAPAPAIRSGFAGVRCVARDRTPLAGPIVDARGLNEVARGAHLADLPRLPGAYALTALGSRGLALAPLLGELIAAQIEGEPAPLERSLIAAVDPARFALQRIRSPNPFAPPD